MRSTFETEGTIIDIGDIQFGALDTTGAFALSANSSPDGVGIAVYQRRLAEDSAVDYKAGFCMKPSHARAMASAILSAVTDVSR